MKNIYALNNLGILININDVDKNNSDKYFCIQCGDELIARKGEINRHHFSHKNIQNCNFETYLHQLSKLIFFKKYNDCLLTKKPFYLQYSRTIECTSCLALEIQCTLKNETYDFNLIDRFDKIYFEKFHNGYIPDIMLESSKSGEVIFIEFAVTHKCELQKINSGIRIIEFDIKEESDLDFLFKNEIIISKSNFNFYNFKNSIEKGNIIEKRDCNNSFFVFSILNNGEARIKKEQMYNIAEELESNDFLLYKVEVNSNNINNSNYINLIKNASDIGLEVKNCHSCKYCIKNDNPYSVFPFFCDNLNIDITDSNNGSSCRGFNRIQN